MREKILQEIKDAFENGQRSPFYAEFYYSLIKLPSGRHIPLPLALRKEIVTFKDLKKIPLSRRKRDAFYFTCLCGAKSFWHCKGWFYTREQQRGETMIKEIALRRLIAEGKHRKLKVVLPDLWKKYNDEDTRCSNCPYWNWDGWEEWDKSWCDNCSLRKAVMKDEYVGKVKAGAEGRNQKGQGNGRENQG